MTIATDACILLTKVLAVFEDAQEDLLNEGLSSDELSRTVRFLKVLIQMRQDLEDEGTFSIWVNQAVMMIDAIPPQVVARDESFDMYFTSLTVFTDLTQLH